MNIITSGSSVAVPFSLLFAVGCTIANMFMDILTRSMYEKKHAKNSITDMYNRVGIFSINKKKIVKDLFYKFNN